MSSRAEVAAEWAEMTFGSNVLDETYVDLEEHLDRYLVVASRIEGTWSNYTASVVNSKDEVLRETEFYLEDRWHDVAAVDLDTGEELPMEIGYRVTFE